MEKIGQFLEGLHPWPRLNLKYCHMVLLIALVFEGMNLKNFNLLMVNLCSFFHPLQHCILDLWPISAWTTRFIISQARNFSFFFDYKYQQSENIQRMRTRRDRKRTCKTLQSEGSIACPSTQSSFCHGDSESGNACVSSHVRGKVPFQQSITKQTIIWEQDYDRLMGVYSSMPHFFVPLRQTVGRISSQLPSFTAVEILYKSQAPLWSTKDMDSITKSYCQAIDVLSSNQLKCTLIQKGEDKFLAFETTQSRNEWKIVRAEPLALQHLNERQDFLASLRKKCQGQSNKLSELSSQIIFLYREYYKLKQEILQKIKALEEPKEADFQHQIKEMTQELKFLRKKRRDN